jgi:homoserine O-acetyltransferase
MRCCNGSYPERVFSALPLAAATRHSAQNIAFHEVGRQAVMADPEWRGALFRRTPRRAVAHGRARPPFGRPCTASSAQIPDRDNPTFS